MAAKKKATKKKPVSKKAPVKKKPANRGGNQRKQQQGERKMSEENPKTGKDEEVIVGGAKSGEDTAKEKTPETPVPGSDKPVAEEVKEKAPTAESEEDAKKKADAEAEAEELRKKLEAEEAAKKQAEEAKKKDAEEAAKKEAEEAAKLKQSPDPAAKTDYEKFDDLLNTRRELFKNGGAINNKVALEENFGKMVVLAHGGSSEVLDAFVGYLCNFPHENTGYGAYMNNSGLASPIVKSVEVTAAFLGRIAASRKTEGGITISDNINLVLNKAVAGWIRKNAK